MGVAPFGGRCWNDLTTMETMALIAYDKVRRNEEDAQALANMRIGL
jgi:hypothetical protein